MITFLHAIDLSLTLRAGQVFCWQQSGEDWVGVIKQTVFWLRQTEERSISFTFKGSITNDTDATRELEDFFQVSLPLADFLAKWKRDCKYFNSMVGGTSFESGLRICRQDPFECLISFIVSANNHIKRISQNLLSIRSRYGRKLHVLEDNTVLYSFPSPEELSIATAEELRELGLGYRAQYIVNTAQLIHRSSLYKELDLLRSGNDVEECRNFLMQFQGVGRKVADCVSLYSLDHHSVVPIDTHMLQIAQKLFVSAKLKKDNTMHERIQALMTERYGAKAGLAHCYLFAADLREFKQSPTVNKKQKIIDKTCG